MTEMREAFLKAADYIEGHPDAYFYSTYQVPEAPNCGSRACVLGWLHVFSGVPGQMSSQGRAALSRHGILDASAMLGIAENNFYDRMNALMSNSDWRDEASWQRNARVAVGCMRKYADKYYPAPVLEALAQAVPVRECVAA